MSSQHRGFVVPDPTDPPDGPNDFRRFANSLRACYGRANIGTNQWADFSLPRPTGITTVAAAFVQFVIDPNDTYKPFVAVRNGDLSWKLLDARTGAWVTNGWTTVDWLIFGD